MTLRELREALAAIPDEFDDREVVSEEEAHFCTFNTVTLQFADWTEVPMQCIALGGSSVMKPILTFWPPHAAAGRNPYTPKKEN